METIRRTIRKTFSQLQESSSTFFSPVFWREKLQALLTRESIFSFLTILLAPTFCHFSAFPISSYSTEYESSNGIGEMGVTGISPIPAEIILLGSLFFSSLLVYWFAPGPVQHGPITKNGYLPRYKDNALFHFMVSVIGFLFFSDGWIPGPWNEEVTTMTRGFYSVTIFLDLFGSLVQLLNIIGGLLCVVLYFKGLYSPTTKDSGTTGKGFLFDFYWGTDLYPKILSVDVKHFVNCRLSMTIWLLTTFSCLYASRRIHGDDIIDLGVIGSSILQIVYLSKFYWWEMGYLRSIDIIEDRAGFYETWGCLVWVPAVYTLHTRIAVAHSTLWAVSISSSSYSAYMPSLILFLIGICGIVLNYVADRQRQEFRAQKAAKISYRYHPPNVWFFNRSPRYIQCFFSNKEEDNEESESTTTSLNDEDRRQCQCQAKLLISGFWGLARHPQYIFELIAAYSWSALCLPSLAFRDDYCFWWSVGSIVLTMFYPFYLTVLLVHRARRDEKKCLKKYGEGYKMYRDQVPYHMVPFLY